MKFWKKVEKWAASLQYGMFYSVLATWLPAAGQQIISNIIHLLWKRFIEIWAENIDNIDEMMGMVDNMMWSVLWKLDLFTRPELIQSMTSQSKIWKAGRVLDRLLSMQSAMTRSDKVVEQDVKKYSMVSALLENNHTSKSAEDMIINFANMWDEYAAKWYSKYMDFNALVMYSDERTLERINYKLTEEISKWKLTDVAWQTILSDYKKYLDSTPQIKDVIRNANNKAMTFYQMATNPELVQNVIWWKVWVMNMRFLNRASRKAWDYAFKIADSITRWDMKSLIKILWQITWEWLYATKLYLLMNNLSQWWVNPKQAYSNFRLPYTVISMASFWAVDIIAQMFTDRWIDKNIGMSIGQSLKTAWFDLTRKMSGRVLVAPIYWTMQYWKIQNWLNMLDENTDMDKAYSNDFWTADYWKKMMEIFSNVIFSRLWRFDTVTAGWYYRDYVWLDSQNKLINFFTNQKITNDVVGADKLMNSFFDLIKETDANWYQLSLSLIPFTRDQRFALRAQETFFKEQWLINFFNWSPYIKWMLWQLEKQLDSAQLEKMYIAMWWNYSILAWITDMADIDNSVAKLLDDWILANESRIEEIKKTYGNKTYDFFMNHLKMAWLEEQKGLLEAWKGITPEEIKIYNDKVQIMADKVEEEIIKMQKTNPKLIKNAAYDDMKKLNIIERWTNQFGEQMMLWIWIDSMAKAQKAWLKDMIIATKGKEWFKQNVNNKSWEVLSFIETENWKYKEKLMAKYYTIALMGNRTLWKDMAILYTNTNPNKPLKKLLNQNVWVWSIVVPLLIQKTIASEWISALWANNVYADLNRKLWNWAWWIEKGEKWEWLKNLFAYKIWIMDYLKQYADHTTYQQVAAGIWASDIEHIKEIPVDQIEVLAPWIRDYLNRVTVSEPLTDEKIFEEVRAAIFKEPWWVWKKKKWSIDFNKLNFKLNKFSDFKTDFVRYVLKEEPLEHITYKVQWATILPLRESAMEARPPKPEYDFVKIAKAGKVITPDIKIETIKTTKASKVYTWKAIKWQNIYVIKTSKWRKK